MYIAMVASECAPVAKVGGLGDVVFGLSRDLEIRGNSVEIILPKYDCLRYDQIFDADPEGEVFKWHSGFVLGFTRDQSKKTWDRRLYSQHLA